MNFSQRFYLAFYIIWWTSGGAYCNFVADHQTNFWRCNLWNYQETANVYQQVLIVKKVNLMIYQPSLSLYIFLVLYDLVVRFIKFWKSKITLWMKQSFKMNKPTCQWCCLQDNSCPPQSPKMTWDSVWCQMRAVRKISFVFVLANVEDKIICGLCSCADGSN